MSSRNFYKPCHQLFQHLWDSISKLLFFFLSCVISKGFLCPGSSTHSSTVWLRWPSAATGSSVPLCCSSSCFSLSSSPLHPANGRWTRCWVPPCSCSTLFSWCSAWCWRIASLSAPFPSEPRELSLEQALSSCVTWSRTVKWLLWTLVWIFVETAQKSYCSCSDLLPVTQMLAQTIFSRTFFKLLVKMAAFHFFFFNKRVMQD